MPKRKELPEPIRWGENGFVYQPSYYYAVQNLPEDKRLMLQDAIIEYAFTGQKKQLPSDLDGYLELITPTIEASIRNYQHGKKGGRPKKENPGL